MIYKNEQSLINIIKYTPLVFIITVSLIITGFLYWDKQTTFQEQKIVISNEFIKTNKEKIKTEVDDLYEFIEKTQKETEERLKKSIKDRVYEAHNIAMRIYNENKDTKTREEITKMIKDVLVDIRFNNGRGYFFIYSFDYECILLPINRKLEGTSFYNFKEGGGTYLTRNIIEQLKKEREGFLSWSFYKPEDMKNQYKKIGFNIHFEPYDWFIGTGEYFVDFEEDVKKEVLEYISRISQNEKDYFFILNYDKKTFYHVIKELIGLPAQNVTNVETKKAFDDMISIAKSGEGFLTYNHKSGNNNEFSTKTSYIKGLDNWQWVIGKGFYQNDIQQLLIEKEKQLDKDYQRKIFNIFGIVFILTIVLLIVSIYISKILERKFKKYKNEIDTHIKENTKQHHILFQQSKMAAMGEMLGNIAHQWRQPLSVITTAATGMKVQKEFGTLDDEAINRSVDTITDSALYLSKTIDDFRNFFKRDKTETNFSTNEVIGKVLKLTKSQFKIHEISIIKNIEEFNLFGLENEFVQALINILNNAKDALIDKEAPKLIFINVLKNDNKAIIKIADNGGGIDEKIIDKVCEPYFTTKHQSQGTGIGLYMTEEIIVKHMYGKFTISNIETIYENVTYKGAQITIELDLML